MNTNFDFYCSFVEAVFLQNSVKNMRIEKHWLLVLDTL
jgi:hypothetical protein